MTEESELITQQQETGITRRIFLVDGHSYLYRAFHATPYMSNSKGIPTNTTYAFISMLKKLMNEEKPDTLIVVFDSKAPSFREEISKAYKAQRPPMPDNLSVQIPYVKMVMEAMGIPILEQAGFEADDIIGTIVEKFREENVQMYIVTGDKDMMQLVSNRVFIRDTMKNLLIGEQEVMEKFGVKPSLMTDYLALCGDTSDNIPGVPGVGEKTAKELIDSIGSIEEIYERLEEVKKISVKEKLVAGKDLAFMSKELATIRIDVPIGKEVEHLVQKEEDSNALRRIYRELEFTLLYKEIGAENTKKKASQEIELSSLNRKNVAIVTNFQGKSPNDIHLDGFAAFDNEGVYFSRNEDELIDIMGSAEEVVIHNIKPVLLFLLNKADALNPFAFHPLPLFSHLFFDTMLASYLLNPLRKDYGIGAIIEEHIDADISSADVKHVLIETVQYLFELKDILTEKMEKLELTNLFHTVEIPLVEVLACMENTGVKIDRKILNELSRDFDKRLTGIMKEIYSLSGEPFNINSPQQLSRILFEKLHLTPGKKTKTGYSTDIEVLEKLSLVHPLPKEILEYRTLTKLKNTYIDVLPTLINPRTGRIHASFNQMVVATGRLSSSDPNLQNIPIRGEEGRRIREAFVTEEGFLLLSSDYSQIELRVLAHISKDELLTDAFLKDEDIHTNVAREVFGVQAGDVTQEMRRVAKVINFGIIYGMSGYGLSKELGVSQRDAQNYIDEYFIKYKGVKAYIESVLEETRIRGFVRTLFGRVRYIPEINNRDAAVRQLGERTAMNTPIQGTAADIIKMAMVSIHRRIRENRLASRLIMQIHDELVFEVKQDEFVDMERIVRHEMEHVINLAVPLKVSLGKGRNWTEAHD
ncbi:MAG: DNA polymerase I [Proteobacteria bacterium]|nr:DNA polymerase I [Pseudomonadota bacterium]